jgi:hypothetical protein
MGVPRTWTQANLSGGLNLKEGIFSDLGNSFAELENYHVREGVEGLSRRPPCKILTGDFDSDTQGMVYLNGAWYTIARRGVTVANTIAGITVTTLFFDLPNYCTATWFLLDLRVHNSKIVAWIRHGYDGGTVLQRVFLHTWDGNLLKPTYCEDGEAPNEWSNFPLHPFGRNPDSAKPLPAYVADFDPKTKVVGAKLRTANADKNLAFCRTNRPRVWNTRKNTDILADGEWWYFITPNATTYNPTLTFTVSERYHDLGLDRRWAGYVFEYLDSTGTWQKFTEQATTPGADKHYAINPLISRTYPGGLFYVETLIAAQTISDTNIAYATWIANPSAVYLTGVLQVDGADYTVSNHTGNARITFGAAPGVGVVMLALSGPPEAFEFQLQLYWTGAADVILRFRMIATPSITLISGGEFTAGAGIQNLFSGNGVTTQFQTTIPTGDFPTVPTTADFVWVGSVSKQFSTHYTVTDVAGFGRVNFGTAPASGTNNVLVVQYANPTSTQARFRYEGADYSASTAMERANDIGKHEVAWLGPPANFGNAERVGGSTVRCPIQLGDARQRALLIEEFVVGAAPPYISGVTAYLYGNATAQESSWYLAKAALYLVELAGDGDAGFLPTSGNNPRGGFISGLAVIGKNLAVFYPDLSQVWSLPSNDPSQDSMVDVGPIGSGDQPKVTGEMVDMFSLVALGRGFRTIDLSRSLVQRLQDNNLGARIQPLGKIVLEDMALWPAIGSVVASVYVNGAHYFIALDYSRELKYEAWSRWTGIVLTEHSDARGSASVDYQTMTAIDDRLYFRSDSKVCYFDASATDFHDFSDPNQSSIALPTDAVAAWHFSHFKNPGKLFEAVGANLSQKQTCRLSVRYNTQDDSVETDQVPLDGETYGEAEIPLAGWGAGLALVIRSNDPAGHNIQDVGLTYVIHKH